MDRKSSELHEQWIKSISKKLNISVSLNLVGVIGGGSINDAHRIQTSAGVYFAKTNVADAYPGMFEAEARGLEFLQMHSTFEIPVSLATGQEGNTQWILMPHIAPSAKKTNYWEDFGRKLAEMHRKTQSTFGLDYDNYLGSLNQYNKPNESWADFFVQQRLIPQLKMAEDRSLANPEMIRYFEKLYKKAYNLFPNEPPAALHGDLWTGNFMTNEKGEATIFDPAVYFGHREMDIAMSKLFGGFDKRFYEAYNESYPLEKGWENRLAIANVYPLMAHINIFGGSYTSQVMGILRKNA
jgi:fructosamine-3-kinase